jgi:hypothetical protein
MAILGIGHWILGIGWNEGERSQHEPMANGQCPMTPEAAMPLQE